MIRCIHCREDVALETESGVLRDHAMTCNASPVVKELARVRLIVDQARVVARHWDTQDGVNGAELDKLRDLVYERNICPNCGGELHQDMVDVGVGEIPCGPIGCPGCNWFEGQPIPSRGELLVKVNNLEVELKERARVG